uniref:Uncharacterized protein n=1 Tax=Bombyx mori TaxID=7091 RepID=A0A8R2GCY5_BOMMO|nr:uncharacterized protein LOC101743139 [Bombyx mori]
MGARFVECAAFPRTSSQARRRDHLFEVLSRTKRILRCREWSANTPRKPSRRDFEIPRKAKPYKLSQKRRRGPAARMLFYNTARDCAVGMNSHRLVGSRTALPNLSV